MDKEEEKKSWNPERAIGNSSNDKVAVIYSVRVRSVRIREKPKKSEGSK